MASTPFGGGRNRVRGVTASLLLALAGASSVAAGPAAIVVRKIDAPELLSGSVHAGLDCADCHAGYSKGTAPPPGADAQCAGCHSDEGAAYTRHGFRKVGSTPDVPRCSDCHGQHDIRAPDDPASRVHPARLADTCGACHADRQLARAYDLVGRTVDIYRTSVHASGPAGRPLASCTDCHGAGGDPHRILYPGHPDSRVNFFRLADTCGKCHAAADRDFQAGIHGHRVRHGDTHAPGCSSCHGSHGVLSVDDPRSPVSPSRIARDTCSPCHTSWGMAEKYGLPPGRLTSFADSYHGFKSRVGDTKVANCASCHGSHRILPASDPESSVNPANVRSTCGKCHGRISPELARIPIHGLGGRGVHTKAGRIAQHVYVVAIAVIIGLMLLHWSLDLGRHLVDRIRQRPRVRRMRPHEVIQHTVLTASFVTLVISGFALVYDETWFARTLFGWEGGFAFRGVLHRIAAVTFFGLTLWHLIFVAISRRGRRFLRDMWPRRADFRNFVLRIGYCVGLRSAPPPEGRFGYVEKAEYWALVWGTAVMIGTGLLLWFDNALSAWLPWGALDTALVVHFWEAWLATLAIGIWHLYATVFDPEVYPMNPSWLTGEMPEEMHREHHPAEPDR